MNKTHFISTSNKLIKFLQFLAASLLLTSVVFSHSPSVASANKKNDAARSGKTKKTTEKIAKKLPLASSMITLGKIDGESTDNMSIVTIRLSEKPNWKKVTMEDHGTFLQIHLPNTIIPEPGMFYEGNSPFIKKIAAFQTTATKGTVRLFLTEDAALVKKTTSAEILDSRIIVTTDHKELQKLLANTPVESQVFESEKSDDTSIAGSLLATLKGVSEDKSSDVSSTSKTKTAGVNSSTATSGASGNPEESGLNLSEKILEISVFLALMIFFLIATLSIKPLLKKRQMKIQGDSYVQMNLLSNLALGPKQKISLIQVGNEQILLSVSSDSINFLSRIGEQRISGSSQGPQISQGGQGVGQFQPLQQPQKTELPSAVRDAFQRPSLKESVVQKTVAQKTMPNQDSITKFQSALNPLRKKNVAKRSKPEKNSGEKRTRGDGDPLSFSDLLTQKPTNKNRETLASPRKKINVQISDDGIDEGTNKNPAPARTMTTNSRKLQRTDSSIANDHSSVEDVTRLIREKLRSLPTI